MLTALRNKATSWVLKVMFGLLIVSFAIWGVGDIFRLGGGPPAVATIGPVEVSGDQFMNQFRNELARLQALLGGQLDAEKARPLLQQRVLDDVVSRTLFTVHADRLGLNVPDEIIVQYIHSEPAFREQGQFDPTRFNLMLQQMQMSEGAYVAMLRHDIARSQILNAISAGIVAPQALVDAVYAYRDEKRIARTLLVANDGIVDVKTPDDPTVEAWYNDNADRYQAPEYRALTLLRLSPEDVLPEIKVSDEELQEAYDARVSEYSMPERRQIEQIVFPDEDAAKAGVEKLAQGVSFEVLAQEVSGGAPVDLGMVSRDQMLPELADSAFGPPEGGVAPPVESPLGWHILRIVKVEPAHTSTLDEVREELRQEIAREKAIDALDSMANQFEDTIAGGAALEEAAKDLDVELLSVPLVDAGGTEVDGKPLPEMPDQAEILSTGFVTGEGQLSPLTETSDTGYFMVRVDSVRASATRPLAEVRQQVIADWQADQRAKAASQKADAIAERLRGGTDIDTLATEMSFTVKISQPFTREAGDPAADIGSTLAGRLFDVKPGEVVTSPIASGTVVARLDEVVPADPAAESAVADVRAVVQRSLIGDVIGQFGEALRQRIDVSVNESAIDALF